MRELVKMFWSFFKIGAFTFGGGYAMIPLIEKEVVDEKKWVTKEDFLDILVVSQSLPGAISINCSLFVGKKIKGVLGSIIAVLGVALPSFLIILCVAKWFTSIRSNETVGSIFDGINAGVPVLVLAGVLSISKSVKRTRKNLILFLIALIILIIGVNPIFIIIGFAIYGGIYLKEEEEA